MNLTIVVCHFKEDLSWLKNIKHNVIVYNKNQMLDLILLCT